MGERENVSDASRLVSITSGIATVDKSSEKKQKRNKSFHHGR